MRFAKGAAGLLLGAVAGAAAWVLMIVVTSGICSVPVLEILWCTVSPLAGGSVSDSITLWDLLLAVGFVGAGAYGGLLFASGRLE